MPKAIRSLRDIEIELSLLEGRIEEIKREARNVSGLATQNDLKDLDIRIQGYENRERSDTALLQLLRRDTELVPDFGKVVHSLEHYFRYGLRSRKIRLFDEDTSLGYWEIRAILDAATSALEFVDEDGIGFAGMYRRLSSVAIRIMFLTADFLPTTDITYSLGSATNRWLKLWVKDADFTGTVTGLPTGTTNSHLQAFGTGPGISLVGVEIDVPGASITLNENGIWYILGTYDVEIGSSSGKVLIGSLNLNGTNQAGVAVSSDISSVYTRNTVSYAWIVNVVSQPVIAKLRAVDVGAGGVMNIIPGNSVISAVYLHA